MIQKPESILQAIRECEKMGRDAFLKKYGRGKAQSYFLVYDGEEYDSKAIVCAAYEFENGSKRKNFSGGYATVQKWLEKLGFEVRVSDKHEPIPCYLLTWNPKRWPWGDFDEMVKRSAEGEVISENWSTGNNRSIQAGERVFLFRVGSERGVIGAGFTTSEVFFGKHWDDPKKQASYVSVDFETLLSVDDILPDSVLENSDLDVKNWNRIQAGGISVPPEIEEIWQSHLRKLGRILERLPNELENPTRFFEGAVRTISVNAYERNPRARKACIAKWGLDCAVCGFNFAKGYGPLGVGFIHIHHLRDLASIGEEYEVDPEQDLRPVCPNCHAMLHRETPAMSIEGLRKCLKLGLEK